MPTSPTSINVDAPAVLSGPGSTDAAVHMSLDVSHGSGRVRVLMGTSFDTRAARLLDEFVTWVVGLPVVCSADVCVTPPDSRSAVVERVRAVTRLRMAIESVGGTARVTTVPALGPTKGGLAGSPTFLVREVGEPA